MQQRLDHIDIAKGLSILVVVFSHNLYVFSPRGDWFNNWFTFQVPLFFFLSGVFFHTKASAWEHLKNKADGLLKPYFVTLILIGVALVALQFETVTTYFPGMLYGNGKTIALEPMWFLTHLFLVTIVAWCLVKTINLREHSSLLPILIAALLIIGIFYIDFYWQISAEPSSSDYRPGLPFSADLIPVTTAYFLLGFALRDHLKKFQVNPLLLILAISTFVSVNLFTNNDINFNMRIYANPVFATIEALSGFYLAMSFSVSAVRIKPIANYLRQAGNGSLFILIFHNIFQYAAYILFVRLTGIDTLVTALFAFVIGATAPLLIWWFFKRQPLLALFYFPLKPHPWVTKNKNSEWVKLGHDVKPADTIR